jgi:CBS domain-containing protein
MTTAREIMTPHPVCVRSDEPVARAAARMAELNVGALPICGPDERLKGMLTDRDIAVRVVAAGLDPQTVTAGECAQGEAVTVGADDPVLTALEMMTKYQIRRLPVIDGHALVGIIALADVARALPEEMSGQVLEALSYN